MSFCTCRFHSRQTLQTSQSTSPESSHLLIHLHYSPEFSRLFLPRLREGGNTAVMNDNFLWSFQLLGWQTLHRREAQSVSQSWWTRRSYTSPRCKVTGVPLHCFSLMCTCEAQKAPDLMHSFSYFFWPLNLIVLIYLPLTRLPSSLCLSGMLCYQMGSE